MAMEKPSEGFKQQRIRSSLHSAGSTAAAAPWRLAQRGQGVGRAAISEARKPSGGQLRAVSTSGDTHG